MALFCSACEADLGLPSVHECFVECDGSAQNGMGRGLVPQISPPRRMILLVQQLGGCLRAVSCMLLALVTLCVVWML